MHLSLHTPKVIPIARYRPVLSLFAPGVAALELKAIPVERVPCHGL